MKTTNRNLKGCMTILKRAFGRLKTVHIVTTSAIRKVASPARYYALIFPILNLVSFSCKNPGLFLSFFFLFV